jgi:hypothetical protein
MRCFREKDPDAVVQIIQHTLGQQLLDKGGRSELVARALLMSAYDQAIERDQGKPLSTSAFVHYSAGVSLITFIEELFTPNYAKDVLDSVPVNVPDRIQGCDGAVHAFWKDRRLCLDPPCFGGAGQGHGHHPDRRKER